MPYRWGEHVGELELRVEAASEHDVLVDAAHALAEVLEGDDDDEVAGDELFEVSLEAPDRPLLLAAWLDELIFLAETEGFVPGEVESLALDGGARLRARIRGRRGSPPHLVKAVTHHDLRFERATDGGWSARAVLDV